MAKRRKSTRLSISNIKGKLSKRIAGLAGKGSAAGPYAKVEWIEGLGRGMDANARVRVSSTRLGQIKKSMR